MQFIAQEPRRGVFEPDTINSMININCPSCSSDLQIDDGFRGGVCRCFDCGTLMTVPDDPDSQSPEPLIRQEGASQKTQNRRAATPKVKAKASAPPSPKVEAGAYQTSSGKEIQISEEQARKIPTATRRKVVRWATRIGVVLVCIGLLVGVGVGAYIAFTSGKFAKKKEKEVTAEEAQKDVIYDNYFENPDPNFMGLKVADKTIFCIDASQAMGAQEIGFVTDSVRACAQVLKDNQQMQAIFWKDTGPISYPTSLTAAAHINPKDMKEALYDITASGIQKPTPAIEKAKAAEPDQIIVVIGQRFTSKLVDEIFTSLEGFSKRLSFVVVVGTYVSDTDKKLLSQLKEKAEETGGEFRSIPSGDLSIWINSWKDKAQEPSD